VIVVIGDSISFGQHLDDFEPNWPTILCGLDRKVINRGVPGDTTRLALERFPRDVQNLNPSAVIIQFGHNDANRWDSDRGLPRVSMSAFKANLYEMIDRCRTFKATPFLCTLTPSYRPDPHPTDCDRYDRVIRQVALDESVPLIDARAAFMAELDPRTLVMEDGLHLTAAGHVVYAAAAEKALQP
jgi:lysophospholipase L1-like esterase